ncbi:hypothetical protein M1615_03320 [Patescibacteria group bacterium]|nr:hypothetical protein [Patescibacteria group bacterium]
MASDPNEIEIIPPGTKPSFGGQLMTLQKAIEIGEYNPEFLATFEEWHTFSKHTQFQLIEQAIENRDRQLIQQWSKINNTIDFSQKPELQQVLRNIEEQRRLLQKDKERLFLEYSKP